MGKRKSLVLDLAISVGTIFGVTGWVVLFVGGVVVGLFFWGLLLPTVPVNLGVAEGVHEAILFVGITLMLAGEALVAGSYAILWAVFKSVKPTLESRD
jgi:hypothetical protein